MTTSNSLPTVASFPDDPVVLNQRAIDAVQQGQIETALAYLAKACAHPNASGVYHRNYAELLRRTGEVITAEALARRAVEINPQDGSSWELLGMILFERGEQAESRQCLGVAVDLNPTSLNAVNNLAVVLQCQGERRVAEQFYRKALVIAPDNLGIKLNLAILLGELGAYDDGLAITEQVLDRAPRMLNAFLVAAELELNRERPTIALEQIELAFRLAPEGLKPLTQRGRVFCRLGRYREALEDYDRLLAETPTNAEALHGRALALQGLNRIDAALDAFDAAEAGSVTPARVIADRAWLMAELGRKDAAVSLLRRALSLQPDLAAAWFYLAYLTKYPPGHPDLATMEKIADHADTPYWDRIRLSFALGKSYLDTEDADRAFTRLAEGNRLKRRILDYDIERDSRRFAEITEIVSTVPPPTPASTTGPQPIFVFGMSRSGTTLVEQILASHASTHGVGEPPHLRDLAKEIDFPTRLPDLTPAALAKIGQRYRDLVGTQAPPSRWTIDKMPSNFIYAGLIPLILPDAKMIHCRRDPLDTCLSCYSLLFAIDHEYTYDQEELGRYYGLYLKLMAHWRRVIGPERLLEIDYEDLVSDTKRQVAKILDFCGLPWDDACLKFHESTRRVSSASLDQVRSPIYTTSIGRAAQFRHWLAPLEAALAANGAACKPLQ